jgi:DNA mismatch endonuclease (patch repair protein)
MREDTLKSLAYTLNKIFLRDETVKRYEIAEEEQMMAAEEMERYNNRRK